LLKSRYKIYCVKCGIVHHPYIEQGRVDYNQHNIQQKSVNNRTAHIKQKLQDLKLTVNEIKAFMEAWNIIEDQLKQNNPKRFPKLDFFIAKILEALDIPKQPSFIISPTLHKKYEIVCQEII